MCPVVSGAKCKVGNLSVGTADELQVGTKVGKKAQLGEQIQVTAKATAKGATPFTGSATDVVVVSPHASPSTSTSVANLPPPTNLPPISGTGVSAGNPSNLFPTVGPAPSPSATSSPSLGLPGVKPHKTVTHVADVSATVPLDPRLIGGQLAGLAVLAGAVAIAIARLSLRAPKPPEDKGQGPSK